MIIKRKIMNFIHRFFLIILCFSIVSLVPNLASATTIMHLSLAEVRDKADLIIIGTVQDVNSRWNDSGKMIVTDYTIDVEEVLKGSIDSTTLICSFAGGTVGDETIQVVGMPQLEIDKRYILFTHQGKKYFSDSIGWSQGIYEVISAETDGEEQSIIQTYDGRIIEKDANGKIRRGGNVVIENGVLTRSSEISLEDLEDFRSDFDRAPEPEVLDPQGNPIPQVFDIPQVETRSKSEEITNFSIATFEDFKSFVKESGEE